MGVVQAPVGETRTRGLHPLTRSSATPFSLRHASSPSATPFFLVQWAFLTGSDDPWARIGAVTGRAGVEWYWWGSWGGPGRGRVQICCKGAPGRDRPRRKSRNINVSPPAPRCDPGLCNRFGQPAPPRASGRSTRAPARTAAAAITPLSGRSAPPRAPRRALCTRAGTSNRTSRVQNAHLDEHRTDPPPTSRTAPARIAPR